MHHVDVDQRAVVHDLALGRVDEAHAAHVRRQLVDLIERARVERQRRLAVRLFAQVEQQELIGLGGRELVLFDVHPAHPIPLALQLLDQVPANEPSGATDECCFHTLLSFFEWAMQYVAPESRGPGARTPSIARVLPGCNDAGWVAIHALRGGFC